MRSLGSLGFANEFEVGRPHQERLPSLRGIVHTTVGQYLGGAVLVLVGLRARFDVRCLGRAHGRGTLDRLHRLPSHGAALACLAPLRESRAVGQGHCSRQ